MTKDVVDGSKYDLLIAGVAAFCLIFIIMLMMTRSLIAALVIVGTVALSLGHPSGYPCSSGSIFSAHNYIMWC